MEAYNSAVMHLCSSLRGILWNQPDQIKKNALEIRLRVGVPPILRCIDTTQFIEEPVVSAKQIEDSLSIICEGAIYAHEREIAAGYLTLKEGHRVGLCGTAVMRQNDITTLRGITSVNLRIARQHIGVGKQLLMAAAPQTLGSFLLVGPPMCGKTTMMRDIARLLSCGWQERVYNVLLADERYELALEEQKNCDVLRGMPKAVAVAYATRAMAPDVIICDEIASTEDAAAIASAANTGVVIIASMHAGNLQQLHRRPAFWELQKHQCFEKAVFLAAEPIGKITEVSVL